MVNEKMIDSESRVRILEHIADKLDKRIDSFDEKWIDHQVRIRLQGAQYKQLNRKLDIIMAICGAIFTVILIPILLHSVKLA